jgi:carbonic anhydrase/acetyltransferase-like protein (isoleucine patch superfamily)
MARVFVVSVDAHVPPLDAPARDVWLLDRPMGEAMARELADAGLVVERVASLEDAEERARREPDGAFVMLDSVGCSRLVLRRFVRAARAKGEGAFTCALPRGIAIDPLAYVDGLDAANDTTWTAPMHFLRGRSASLAAATPLVLPYKETVFRVPFPPVVDGKNEEELAISESWLCNVSHWVHALRINVAAIPAWWFSRVRRGAYVGGVSWFAWRALCGFPWVGGRLKDTLRDVSLRANVHHTARVGLSVVAKGATIGALANVDSSFIGEGANIGDGAQVYGSVIGPGAWVGRNSVVVGSLVYPGALAGQLLMQVSVLGEKCCAFTNSGFFDLNFTRNIRVAHRGRVVDSGSKFLGACVGPEARVGAGVWVASGREVPARALLIKPPNEIVSRIGALPAREAHVVRDGVAVPLEGSR